MHPSAHAIVLPSPPLLRRAHSFRISSGRGETAPPESAEMCRAPSHKPRSSSGRGGNRPLWKRQGVMRPRKRRNSSGPGGHPPPVSQPCTLGEVLVTCRSSTYCLSVGVSVWLRSRALRTDGARAPPHTLFATPLGVPMWHACSRLFLCLHIVTMRPRAPSDISEEGSGYESG